MLSYDSAPTASHGLAAPSAAPRRALAQANTGTKRNKLITN